ncbi:MAG: hypothetical protein ACF8OB_02855 [Phycisphaeraceae bacterium JB051]
MQEFRLSFGAIRILSHEIMEVVVDEGLELTLEQVAEYHEFIIDRMPVGCGILVNKANSYTYNFEAQQNIFLKGHIKAFALLVHNTSAKLASESLILMQRGRIDSEIKIFEDFDTALQWLADQVNIEKPDVAPKFFPENN